MVAQKQRVLQADVCKLHLRMLKHLHRTLRRSAGGYRLPIAVTTALCSTLLRSNCASREGMLGALAALDAVPTFCVSDVGKCCELWRDAGKLRGARTAKLLN